MRPDGSHIEAVDEAESSGQWKTASHAFHDRFLADLDDRFHLSARADVLVVDVLAQKRIDIGEHQAKKLAKIWR